ncbi:MAG: hypothetical protein QG556_226 [Pseudomonadota bacterium]|nr:hypothetical protein [Pseudomonadota bacterium]
MLVLPLLMFLMSLWDMRIWQDLLEMKILWKNKVEHPLSQVLIKEEPCLLMCRPDCVSVAIWKLGERYVTKPMTSNLCNTTQTLKIDKVIVFDAM